MKAPIISIVVTTRNEEKNIENCLNSIEKQNYPKDLIEIIVVDNNSKDKTKQIAKKYTDKIYNIGPERSAQRNFGLKKSRGKYFMYLDVDMILSPKLLKESTDILEKDSSLLGLYVPEIVMGEGFWSKVRRFERSFYNATVIDCIRIVRTKSLKEVDGFDESLTGPEDWDMDKKIRNKGKVGITKAFISHNESNFKLSDYINKKAYYSKSFDKYINKWGKDDRDIKKQFGLFYRFIGVFVEKNKWLNLLLSPHLTFGMFFLRFLVGVKFLTRK